LNEVKMKQSVSVGWGILWGSIAAGPIFVATTCAILLYAELPKAIAIETSWFELDTVMGLILAAVPVTLLGFILALIPNAFGATIIGNLGRHVPFARLPLTWAAAGIVMAVIPISLFGGFRGDQAATAAGLIITSGICALVCRKHTRWSEAPEARPNPEPASVSPPARSALAPRNTGARLLD
jgi:hypothetical protein